MDRRRELHHRADDSPGPDEVFVVASRQRSGDLARAVERVGCTVKSLSSIDPSALRCALVVIDCEQDVQLARQTFQAVRSATGWRGSVLAITRDRRSAARAMLLESGADLVLSEPFAQRELVASVDALMRRSARAYDRRAAGVTTDTVPSSLAREPLVHGTPLRDLAKALQLTETERLLLEILGTATTPVPAARLQEAVFSGNRYAANSSHLRVHMHRLRTKLIRAGLGVEGLYGRGYQLVVAIPARPCAPSLRSRG